MAVVNVKSTVITNADATPKVFNKASLDRARILESVGYAAIASGDSIGSTYRVARVRSGDRISQIVLSCVATASAVANIGLYRTSDDGGAVVDADLFASAQALTSALGNSDVTHESGEFAVAEKEQAIWQLLGLSADPFLQYDVVLTLTAAATGAGGAALNVRVAPGP